MTAQRAARLVLPDGGAIPNQVHAIAARLAPSVALALQVVQFARLATTAQEALGLAWTA